MKTLVFILIVVWLISGMVSAQTNLNLKPDSLKTYKDTFQTKNFEEPIKLNNPFAKELPRLALPKNKLFPQNPNLALNPNREPLLIDSPNSRMPVLKPYYQSNMPVMKPDSLVHYHLRIKRF